jgi:hypothetical protein
MDKTTDRIDAVNSAYDRMLPVWELTNDLMGGARAMLDNCRKWLPQETMEPPDAYDTRVGRSVLFNAYKKGVKDLARKPFAKAVTVKGKETLGEKLSMLPDRMDSEGHNITQFCRLALDIAIHRGLCHILVDYPREGGSNLAEQRTLDTRPQFVALDPQSVIGWQYEVKPNGDKELIQLRILETTTKNNDYEEVEVEQIRVIYPDKWQTYVKTANSDKWVLDEEGPYTLGKIGLVTFYINKVGFMEGHSALEDLAYMNLGHYQSQSDHRNNLRFARSGLLFGKGMTDKDVDRDIAFGVNHAFLTTAKDADLKMVEHTGSAIKAGEEELRHLEEQMEVMGLEPLIIRSWGGETAMGKAIEESKGQCALQSWVRGLEGAMEGAFEIASEWAQEPLSDDFGLDIFDDFGLTIRSAEDLKTILRLRELGDLSRQTTLESVKGHGVLPEVFDPEAEGERIKEEGPDLTGDVGDYD